MDWDDFGPYPGKAMTTFGDTEDFKHFLPRILELYFRDLGSGPNYVFIVFSKFDEAGFDDWEKEEREAVIQFLYSWLNNLKSNEPNPKSDLSDYSELLNAINEYSIFNCA